MLVIYNLSAGTVISISGCRLETPDEFINPDLVNGIRLADGLPEGQAEWRIYDVAMMNRIWEACDKGAALEVALDANGQPVGMKADGVPLLPGATPT